MGSAVMARAMLCLDKLSLWVSLGLREAGCPGEAQHEDMGTIA